MKLNIRTLPADENDSSEFVLIEGNRKTLEWLGDLLIEHARGQQGCGIQLHPNGAGNKRFSRTANVGIYVHLLPCDHPTAHSERLAGRRSRKPNKI
jgi:hypothetical protein